MCCYSLIYETFSIQQYILNMWHSSVSVFVFVAVLYDTVFNLQPTVEMHWAMKAYQHAETYFSVSIG